MLVSERKNSVYTSTGAAEGQAERERGEDRPLYLAMQALILE